jgi:hypothetical protein
VSVERRSVPGYLNQCEIDRKTGSDDAVDRKPAKSVYCLAEVELVRQRDVILTRELCVLSGFGRLDGVP